MVLQLLAVCKRVRHINGLTDVLFTCPADFWDNQSQEQHVQINAKVTLGDFVEGETYPITIGDPVRALRPDRPHPAC